MIFKMNVTSFLIAGLLACWTQTVMSAVPSPTSSFHSEAMTPSDGTSSSASPSTPAPTPGAQAAPTTNSSLEGVSATAASAVRRQESLWRHNQTASNGSRKAVFANHGSLSRETSSHGTDLRLVSHAGQLTGSATQRSEAAIVPTVSFTSERTVRETSEALSMTPSPSVHTTPTTAVFQADQSASALLGQHSSSSQHPSATSSTSAVSASVNTVPSTEDSPQITTPSLDAQTWTSPSIHTSVSDSSTTKIDPDSASSSSATAGMILAESSGSPGQVTDFSASWPDEEEAGSFDSSSSSSSSSSSQSVPPTTPHTTEVSFASKEESSQTAPAVLEPSSGVHFTSTLDVMVQSSTPPSTTHPPTVTHSAVLSSSVHFSTPPLASASVRQQTSDRLMPSHTSFSHVSASASTPAATPNVPSANATDLKETSSALLMTTPSTVRTPVMVTVQQVSPSPSTPDSGTTQTLTVIPLPANTTTTPSTTTTPLTTTTTLPARRDVRYQFTLTGDCHLILNNTEFFQRFLAGFHDLIVKQLGIGEDTYRLGEISCGTVHVFITFLHVTMPDFDIRLQTIIHNGGPGLSIPVWIDSHFATFDLIHAKHVPLAPDEHTYNIVAEVMDDVDIIVIIVACCICGVLIAIGIAICVKECYRRKHASSFNLLDVQDVNLKLEDFTLTRIPRPRTIYKEPASAKSSTCSRGGPGNSAMYAGLSTGASNGHAKISSNGTLHPADLHLRIREHSDGIIVGVTAAMTSSHAINYPQYVSEETEGFINGSAGRSKARIRTPSADYTSEGECPASERLLPAHHQAETEGATNPVFVDEQEEKENGSDRAGAL